MSHSFRDAWRKEAMATPQLTEEELKEIYGEEEYDRLIALKAKNEETENPNK